MAQGNTAIAFKPIEHEETVAEKLIRVMAENEALRAKLQKPVRALTFKIGEKGGLSIYGLGRFPVTLYKEQWLRLLDDKTIADIKAFLKTNDSKLKTK